MARVFAHNLSRKGRETPSHSAPLPHGARLADRVPVLSASAEGAAWWKGQASVRDSTPGAASSDPTRAQCPQPTVTRSADARKSPSLSIGRRRAFLEQMDAEPRCLHGHYRIVPKTFPELRKGCQAHLDRTRIPSSRPAPAKRLTRSRTRFPEQSEFSTLSRPSNPSYPRNSPAIFSPSPSPAVTPAGGIDITGRGIAEGL